MKVGEKMGTVLTNVRDSGADVYEVVCGGNINIFKCYVNDQDIIQKKSKKFMNLVPDSTPILFGSRSYQAYVNTAKKRGWLGHCRLSTPKIGAEGQGYLMWEFWETRCNKPRIDGIVIREGGEVVRIQDIESWLVKNELSSDVDTIFDQEFYAE
jgi:hypothetical protein